MEVLHLIENEVKLCADSIATGSAAESVSDKSKKHLRGCDDCQKRVKIEADFLKIKYSNDIAECLNNPKNSTNNKHVWIGILSGIIIAGIIGFVILTNSF